MNLVTTFLFTESFSDWSSVSTSGLKSAQYDHYFCTYTFSNARLVSHMK